GEVGTATIKTSDAWQFVVNRYASLVVPDGKTLTLAAGAVVKLDHTQLLVSSGGTLQSQGTAEAPVYLTSAFDDAIGGRVNGVEYIEGRPDNPAPGDWPGVTASPGSTVGVDHAVLRYASVGLSAQ